MYPHIGQNTSMQDRDNHSSLFARATMLKKNVYGLAYQLLFFVIKIYSSAF